MQSKKSISALAMLGCLAFAPQHAWADGRNAEVDGYYVGLFAGAVVIDSTVDFPATETRPAGRIVDQGGDGLILGVRAGWGTMLDRTIYAGFEGEIVLPHNVTSRLDAYGAEYRARLRNELGVYGRLGWVTYGHSLIYLRAGVSVPRQNFESVQGGNDAKSADFTLVPTIGGGMEMNFSQRLFGRADITYSWPTGENAIESYRFTAGLGMRF